MSSADTQGARWRSYRRLKTRIEAIGARGLRNATADFRNAFTHRFSARVESGITNLAQRHVSLETGRIHYTIGGTAPLSVKELVVLLEGELERCYAAFTDFQFLVAEQVAFVTAKNDEMLAQTQTPSSGGCPPAARSEA